MEKKINLIPSELVASSKTTKFVAILNKLSVIGSVLLLIVIIGFIVGYLYFSSKLNDLSYSIDTLKKKIVLLEKSEQKLILTKDRISKIAIAQKNISANDELLAYESFLLGTKSISDLMVTETSVLNDKTEISVVTNNSTALSAFITFITTLKEYKNIILSTLDYNPSIGFLSSLIMK